MIGRSSAVTPPLVQLCPHKLDTDVISCHLGMCDKHALFFFLSVFFVVFFFNTNSVKVCAQCVKRSGTQVRNFPPCQIRVSFFFFYFILRHANTRAPLPPALLSP